MVDLQQGTLVLLCLSCSRYIPTSSVEYSPEKQCRTLLQDMASPFKALAAIERGEPFPQSTKVLPYQNPQDPPVCQDFMARPQGPN